MADAKGENPLVVQQESVAAAAETTGGGAPKATATAVEEGDAQRALGGKVEAFLKWLRRQCVAAVDIVPSPTRASPPRRNNKSLSPAAAATGAAVAGAAASAGADGASAGEAPAKDRKQNHAAEDDDDAEVTKVEEPAALAPAPHRTGVKGAPEQAI